MADKQERLLNLDNAKLIDVVKNYRQYGYDIQLRETAINILAERGISKEHLELTGNFENKTYNYAQDLFQSFLRNSKIAFFLYLVLFASRILVTILPENSTGLGTTLLVVTLFAFVGYFLFLIRSFLNQDQFYKAIGQDYGTEGVLLYLLLGMPFYLFMYFYFRNQMRNKIKEIT